MTDVTNDATTARPRYHHGDLANALTREATALAREGGPEAVVLREAARRVGVSATAAYRHFAAHEDLLYAVKERAHEDLADTMEAAVRAAEHPADPAGAAISKFLTIGDAYISFAVAEPGLFRSAFCRSEPGKGGESAPQQPPKDLSMIAGHRSFQILGRALDELVEAGVLTPEARAGAEFPVWAAVHGLAMLMLDGPLGFLPAEQRAAIQARTGQLIFRGLTG